MNLILVFHDLKVLLEDKREIAYEFENAVIEVLAYKLINAALKKQVKTVMLAWWVSANDKFLSILKRKFIVEIMQQW